MKESLFDFREKGEEKTLNRWLYQRTTIHTHRGIKKKLNNSHNTLSSQLFNEMVFHMTLFYFSKSMITY